MNLKPFVKLQLIIIVIALIFGLAITFASTKIVKTHSERTDFSNQDCSSLRGIIQIDGCDPFTRTQTIGYPISFKTTTFPSNTATPYENYSQVSFAQDTLIWGSLAYLTLNVAILIYRNLTKSKIVNVKKLS